MCTVKLRLDTCDRYFKGDHSRMVEIFCDFEEVCNDSGIEMRFEGLDIVYAKDVDVYGLCRFASKIPDSSTDIFSLLTLIIAEAAAEITGFDVTGRHWSLNSEVSTPFTYEET